MLWSELPRDIPSHDYFPRYGPLFELVSDQKKKDIFSSYKPSAASPKDPSLVKESEDDSMVCQDEVSDSDQQVLKEAKRVIELTTLYIDRQREKKTPIQKSSFCYDLANEKDDAWMDGSTCNKNKKRSSSGGGRRRKKKRPTAIAPQKTQKTQKMAK